MPMTANGYVAPPENLPPALPIERYRANVALRTIYESGPQLRARRNHFEGDDESGTPDLIAIDAYAYGNAVSAGIGLTPAMVVHLANEMLTDNERAAIRQPATSEVDA